VTRISLAHNPAETKLEPPLSRLSPRNFAGSRALADIVLINPRFEMSFWGLEAALPFLGKRANLPVGALPLLAALTLPPHSITIIDENVEEIDYERCRRADIVGVTGMIVQRRRMRSVLVRLKEMGCYTVVGGPWISVSEQDFGDLADAIFVGEAEETWPQFLADWSSGAAQARYEQNEKTDMSTVPTPRFDLLKMNRYAFGSIQFSRGCPFQCEFCDIIVIYGRKPRIKTRQQIIAELEALLATKTQFIFVVDDNLIGDKKAMKGILTHVVAWQQERGYPFMFVTEASLDLADDPEMMSLMVRANFNGVFVGIESINERALRETKKTQNMRNSGTLVEKVERIHRSGLEVWAGFIVGFDNDSEDVFENQLEFVEATQLSVVMVGMLSAIPKTPLYARLEKEGRLDLTDPPPHGTNVIPLKMNRKRLSRGYARLMADLYEPKAFFTRVDRMWLNGPLRAEPGWRLYASTRPVARILKQARGWIEACALAARLAAQMRDSALRNFYLRRFAGAVRRRPDGVLLRLYVIRCLMHYHLLALSRQLEREDASPINTY
jgi:radical SAM superfamily enzyme YgiQ (UPF0313 family)